MDEKIDARGLSCPQPVILTINTIKKLKGGTFDILVDTETSKENVTRAAAGKGWDVTTADISGGYCLTISKD